VLLLRRLKQLGESSPSELATVMRMSLPAVSQMIDRLFILALVTRGEVADDRRRKRITISAKGDALLGRIRRARATEYAAGTARLSPAVRAELSAVLGKALRELPEEADAVASESSDTRV
jgi:DNA-binding MarR family transcriptional regulator